VYLREEKKQLRRKEDRLREKEMFLLRKEEQLRVEKNKLSGESHIFFTLTLTWCATDLRASPFAEAIYSHNGTVLDRILQLPNNIYWVDDSTYGSSLFVRDCYEKLWDFV
jgi:hypothetical protein